MINRILIRIKVVQILYSYLLSRSEFKIDSAPEGAPRDRRFAYAVYLDMLCLIQELSGIRTNNPERSIPGNIIVPEKLRKNAVGRALADNPMLKEIIFRQQAHLNQLGPILQHLADAIADSTVYKDYARRRKITLDDDIKLWRVLLETTILKDPELVAVLRQDKEEFSLAGYHHGIMQAVDTLKAYNDARALYAHARQELQRSLDKAYELYYAIFVLITELTAEEADRLEAAKGKYLATSSDLNPDTRFIDNAFARFLADNPQLQKFVEDKKTDKEPVTWLDSPGLLKALLDAIHESEAYRDYMSAPTVDWAADCELWRSLLRSVILPSDALAEALEAKSIYWNDDLESVGTFALKTIRRFASSEPDGECPFLPQFKDEEDAEFGASLFTLAVENRATYREYIDRFINPDWDPERLAFMDIVIMITAITEILNFPTIPLPVSLNEYVEIANNYSTQRSGSFINGILYSVVAMLADEGLLKKPFTPRQA